jgi:hypothetical protein
MCTELDGMAGYAASGLLPFGMKKIVWFLPGAKTPTATRISLP